MARDRILHLLEDQVGLNLYSRRRMVDGPGLLCLAVTLLLLAGCDSGEVPLPQSIGLLRLEKLQAGEEARRGINRLHGKQIGFERGYIGFYAAENGRARIWLSEHSSSSEAAESVEKMAGRMTQGKQQVFFHFRQMIIEERKVYFVVGMGRVHYFFQKGAKVIWLAIDPPLANEVIRDAVRKF